MPPNWPGAGETATPGFAEAAMVGKNFKALAHFHRLTEYIVQCKHCEKTLSSKHTSSNLTRHLIRNHKLLARSIFAGEEGKMLAELKDELEASASEDLSMELGEGETKSAVRGIMNAKLEQEQMERHSQEEMRNKVIGKNNKLWAHFIRISEFMAKCMHCGKTLSSKHSSSNLMRHIVRRHTSLAKTLNHSHQHLMTPKKDSYASLERRQAADPLEKVNFDDVDSIIEKVADHLEEEVCPRTTSAPLPTFSLYMLSIFDLRSLRFRCRNPSTSTLWTTRTPWWWTGAMSRSRRRCRT